MRRGLAALALLASCAAVVGAARISDPCQSLTGIVGCVECMGSPPKCMRCHEARWPVWNSTTGRITSCRTAASTNAGNSSACAAASGDAQCLRCDASGWCYQCKMGRFFDASFNCAPDSAAAGSCRNVSRNAECGACNPDFTCKLCSSAAKLVVPMNAIFINMPGAESQCLNLTRLGAEALDLTGSPLSLPAGCREVTADFKCARCQDGYSLSLATNKCVAVGGAGGSGCPAGTPWREYCQKCGKNAAGKVVCQQCTWGRVPDAAGACSINCKRLWGIGCLRCNAALCTQVDPAYSTGRK